MKKRLEEELMSLAHSILQLSGRSDLEELKNHALKVYERLHMLTYIDKHFEADLSNSDKQAFLSAMESEYTAPLAETQASVEEEDDTNNEDKELPPVAFDKREEEIDLANFSWNADDLPEFDPIEIEAPVESQEETHLPNTAPEKIKTKNEISPNKKNLNEKLNFGLKFGLNDRLAFTHHLFNGNTQDFNRVISQLNTFESYSDAKLFIEEQIKPEYDWKNKVEYEKRFLMVLKNKLN